MFTCVKGHQLIENWPKAASTALAVGTVLRPNGSGAAVAAVAATVRILGINQKAITSADADYALTTPIPVLVPQEHNEFEADVSGTATAAMVGEKRDLDATGLLVDVAASAHGQVTITKFISASKVIVKFNAAYMYSNAV